MCVVGSVGLGYVGRLNISTFRVILIPWTVCILQYCIQYAYSMHNMHRNTNRACIEYAYYWSGGAFRLPRAARHELAVHVEV